MTFRDARIVPAAIALILGLTACAAPQRSSDYREQHPIVVSQETVVLTLATGATGGMFSSRVKTDMDHFIAAYHTRAAGPIAISLQAGSGGEGERLARLQQVRDALIRAGVADADIVVVPTGTSAPDNKGAVLSFRANAIKVPDCEDWKSNPNYNWSNRNHSNYGCSVQRNLGLTIADPGDLRRAKPLSGMDANRAAGAIGGLQGGPAGGGAEAGGAAGDAAAAGAAAGQ